MVAFPVPGLILWVCLQGHTSWLLVASATLLRARNDVVVGVALLVLLQIRLWFGEGGISNKIALDKQWESQRQINEEHRLRNQLIAQEVESFKTNLDSLEEKARKDLGMIKDGEVFYLVIDKKKQPATDRAEP